MILKWLYLAVFLLASGKSSYSAAAVQLVWFEVPNGLMNTEGNDFSYLPFSYLKPVRYQQVFDASQFSRIPTGGAFLTRIFWRADCSHQKSWIVTNLQINFSTTTKSPDGLSLVFSENAGTDDTLVFGPTQYIPPAFSGCPGSFLDASEIEVTTPFFYDPARGNLLMDIRKDGVPGSNQGLAGLKLDAHTITNDSVSRVAAFSLQATTAEVVDTTGLVLAFQFDPTPSITVTFETNNVVVTFPLYPRAFRLQWSDSIINPVWTYYPGTVAQAGFFRSASIPRDSLLPKKYFRLFLQTTQP